MSFIVCQLIRLTEVKTFSETITSYKNFSLNCVPVSALLRRPFLPAVNPFTDHMLYTSESLLYLVTGLLSFPLSPVTWLQVCVMWFI